MRHATLRAMSDRYEREHMANEGVVLRDKMVAKGGLQAMLLGLLGVSLLAALGLGGAAIATGRLDLALTAAGALLMGAFFAFSWLTTTVLRTVVTTRELHIQCGPWGPRIPLEEIASCRVGDDNRRISVGKRYESGMWTSSYLLTTGKFVELVWKGRRIQFSPQDPEAVAAAIDRARTLRIEAPARIAEPVAEAAAEPERAARRASR